MLIKIIITTIGIWLITLAICVWLKFFEVEGKIEDLTQKMQMGDEKLSSKIRTICSSQEVIPHYNIIEDSCKIYKPDNSLLCVCDNELTFLDILCQISRKSLTGYYVVKNDIKYIIKSDGRVDTKDKAPLFTKYDDYTKELVGF